MQQLEKLLAISKEEFYSDYYQQKHRHVSSAFHFDDALQLSDIETYLATVPLTHGHVQLVNNNTKPGLDQFMKLENGFVVGNELDTQKLLGLLRNGTTAIFNDMGKYIPKLGSYCERLENELGVRIQANVYITPPDSQGFLAHVDSHDVFVLQLFGEKNWRLYEGIVEYPTKRLIDQQKEFSEDEHGLLANVKMQSGDLLYVPQGMYHDASTRDEPSIHITLGILPKRRSDILEMLLKDAKDRGFFRRYVPDKSSDKAQKQKFIQEFKEACHQVIDEADINELLDRLSSQFNRKQVPDLNGALVSALSLSQLNVNSLLQRRPEVRFWFKEEEWFTTINFYKEQIRIPKPIVHVLDTILCEEPFTPKDISADLGDHVKLDLIKKFVTGGFLKIIQ